uniref:Uncharacterized protein n=1 Tax=Heterorhabditis bacteriophora TaxID=37862 RepID=A0A1I7WYA0_HETBA
MRLGTNEQVVLNMKRAKVTMAESLPASVYSYPDIYHLAMTTLWRGRENRDEDGDGPWERSGSDPVPLFPLRMTYTTRPYKDCPWELEEQ